MITQQFNPERLNKLRLRNGYTQEDLAHELRRRGMKTSAKQIRRWEMGAHAPRADVIPLLADALGVPMDELFGDADSDDEEDDAVLLRDIQNLPLDLRRRLEKVILRKVGS